jgi:hypothetical protein
MIECPDQPCEWCTEFDHLVVCDCHCCTSCGTEITSDPPGSCGLPVHGCVTWVDDREHPEWISALDEEWDERTALCGPCREAA